MPPLDGCTCGHLACVCHILKEHIEGCRYPLSATCAIPIECKHGYDVCPECDPCTCDEVKGTFTLGLPGG